jgi:glycosyltransferase involved in cell wall biosynthesis
LLYLGNPYFDRRIQNFYRFFSSHGYQVEIIAGVHVNEVLRASGKFSTRILPIQYSSGPLKFLSYHHKLLAELKRLPAADIVISCDLYSLRAAATIKSTSPKTKLLYDAREIYTLLPTVQNKPAAKFVWETIERQGLQQTDVVITTAPRDANALLAVHSFLPRSIVIKNTPYSSDVDNRVNSLRDHFNIPATKNILVYVGGLQHDRGLEKVIEATKQLNDDASLILIGDGVLKQQLQEIVNRDGLQQSVFFYGASTAEEVLPLLRSADVGISLIERLSGSYRLALPSKVFEYLHAGLPVVSSLLEQIIDCLKDREYVFFANENDQSEIVAAIRKALAYSTDKLQRTAISTDAVNFLTFESDAVKLLSILSYPSSVR